MLRREVGALKSGDMHSGPLEWVLFMVLAFRKTSMKSNWESLGTSSGLDLDPCGVTHLGLSEVCSGR